MYESPAYCGILLDSKGPFAICHPRVNPNVSNCRRFTITPCSFLWQLFCWEIPCTIALCNAELSERGFDPKRLRAAPVAWLFSWCRPSSRTVSLTCVHWTGLKHRCAKRWSPTSTSVRTATWALGHGETAHSVVSVFLPHQNELICY